MEETKNVIINPHDLIYVLTLRYIPTQKSLLPKLVWNNFIPSNQNPSIDFIQKLIENSIKNSFDKTIEKVSIALSGGVDSTLVLTLFNKIFPNVEVEAFSIKFAKSVDETYDAKRIADDFNIHQTVIYLDNYLAELPKAISIIKQPFWDLHWYHVCKNSSLFSKYMMSGDGGDELFGGYTFRYKKFLSLIANNSPPLDKTKSYLECHERDHVPDQEKLFTKKTDFSWKIIYDLLIPYFDNSLENIDQVFLADFNGKLLYNFLPVNTKLHNYFYLNSISPILSKKMILYATHIPNNFKYDPKTNTGKILLRKILQKYKKEQLVSREKLGFNVNTINLWKSHGSKICKKYLADARVVNDGWINEKWINKYIDKEELDVKYVNKFLGLLAVEIWYRLFITKEMRPDKKL